MLHAILDGEERMHGTGGSWNPFGGINQWGHSQGLEPAWVGDAIYIHFIVDNINNMWASPNGGYWHYTMSSPYSFLSNFEALEYGASSDSDVTKTAYGGGALGSQDILYENSATGTATIIKTPFWRITGSYYNELYYFSGLVAYDIFAAQASMIASYGRDDLSTASAEDITYWDFIRTTDFPEPIIGMPPALGKAGGAKVIKSLRGIKLSDYIRTGKTLVPNQLIKGPGTPGATVTWGIKGGGKNIGFHYHIHKYNWYKPRIWFKQTPIIKPPK